MHPLTRFEKPGQRRPLLWFSAAFAASALIVTALLDVGLWVGTVICVILTILIAIAMLVVPRWQRIPVLAGFAVGTVWCTVFVLISYAPVIQYDGRVYEVVFTAEKYAVGYGSYGVVEGTVSIYGGRSYGARLYLDDGSPDFAPGDVLRLVATVKAAEPGAQNGLLPKGIYLKISQKGEIIYSPGEADSLRIWGANAAKAIGDKIMAFTGGGDAGGLLTALIAGDQSRYSRQFNSALINSGSSHITSVSGMHVSILVTFWVALLGRRLGLYTALPLVFALAAVAGFAPSMLRSAIMCAAMVMSFIFRREHDTITALFVSLLLLVAVNPFSILAPSLLLSFASTLGLILYSPMMLRGIRRYMPAGKGLAAKGLKYMYSTVASSAAAMVFTLPLCVVFFSRVSLAAVFTSIIVLWAVSASMIIGIFALIISVFSVPAAQIFADILLQLPLKYTVSVISWVGSNRWVASAQNIYFLLAALALVVVVILASRRKLRGLAPLLIAATGFLSFFIFTAIENKLYIEIEIYGSNGSAVILTRSGDKAYAVNAGGSKGQSAAFIDDTLADWGISALEEVVLTSAWYKNAGGLAQALNLVEAGAILAPEGVVTGLEDDGAAVLCYNDSGALSYDGFTLELYKVSDEVYIPRLRAGDVSIANLCGVLPLDALAALQAAPPTDILLVDSAYSQKIYSLQGLCDMLGVKLLCLSDDGYTGTYYLEKAFTGEVCTFAEDGKLRILTLKK